MSRKGKTLIVVFIILLLLGGAYYGSTIRKNRKAETSSYTPTQKLGKIESGELVKIEKPGLVLEKKDNLWELAYLEGKIPPNLELDQRQILTLVYSLSNIWIERIVDEAPQDLSSYGLDKPATLILTGLSGEKAAYILGDMTPSRTAYYAMEKGDPAVYTISSYQAELMSFALDDVRERIIFPGFVLGNFVRLRIEAAGKKIEISAKPEAVPAYLSSSYSPYLLTSPYLLPRGVRAETLHYMLEPLNNLEIQDFIADSVDYSINNDPPSLAPYGLDRPMRITLETGENSLELLIGNETDGKRYAKLSGVPSVFTVGGLDRLLNIKAFDLVDKFFVLINIDMVESLIISGGERNIEALILSSEDDGVFFLNGEKAENRSFRVFYQSVVGLLADAECPALPAGQSVDAEITVEFRLNAPADSRASITLVPYNRDFYAVRQEGRTEFLVSRNQVRNIFEAAGKVVLLKGE